VAELDWERLGELAGKVAREIAGKWAVVEADDVKQEILVHALEERHVIERYQHDEDLMRKIFWNAGRRYAAKERAYRDLMDDQYYYTPEEVRGVLRSFIYTDSEVGEQMGKKDDLTRCTVADNIMSARMDASKSLNKLSKDYRELVLRHFVYGLPPADEAEKRRGYRAVDALALAMNRHIRTSKGAA
jgi:DNA-directed RNA polymerase specialized sigma24 family protein